MITHLSNHSKTNRVGPFLHVINIYENFIHHSYHIITPTTGLKTWCSLNTDLGHRGKGESIYYTRKREVFRETSTKHYRRPSSRALFPSQISVICECLPLLNTRTTLRNLGPFTLSYGINNRPDSVKDEKHGKDPIRKPKLSSTAMIESDRFVRAEEKSSERVELISLDLEPQANLQSFSLSSVREGREIFRYLVSAWCLPNAPVESIRAFDLPQRIHQRHCYRSVVLNKLIRGVILAHETAKMNNSSR